MLDDNSWLMIKAHEAITRGDKNAAQQILVSMIKQDNKNIDAWLLLADILESPQQRIESLEYVLKLSPENIIAKKRLREILEQEKRIRQINQTLQPAIPKPQRNNHAWLWILVSLIGLIFIICLGLLLWQSANIARSNLSQTQTRNALPQHTLNDIHLQYRADNGNVSFVLLYIVVDKSFTVSDARTLINYYTQYYNNKYSGSPLYLIDFFCDNTYASWNEDPANTNGNGEDFYRHVLYEYIKAINKTVLIPIDESADSPTMGSACK
jgi:hypothetical protein